jgi:3-hydroxyethyl bacteriochlorophyllide a dehydrogenase
MPPFPGLGYPLVPGYETVGQVVRAGPAATVAVGSHVFIPGSYSFQGVRNIFGGAGARLIVPHDRVVPVAADLGPKAVLLALAATCYHAIAIGGQRQQLGRFSAAAIERAVAARRAAAAACCCCTRL